MDRDLRIRMLLEAGDKFTRPVRDMANGSNKLAVALKATRDRLKDVQRAQADIAGFRALKTGIGQTETAMRQAQARASALGHEISQVDKPTRAMTRDFAAARREAEQLARQHQVETGQLGQLRERLRAAGVETGSLARHERELRTAAAGANREIEEQSRRLTQAAERARRFGAAREGFSRTMGNATGIAAGGASAIATGAAVAAPVVGSVKAAQDYQSVMTDIAQKANLTRREADLLGRQLLVNARAANQLPAAMQSGVDTLTGFGASVPNAVAMMRPIGRAATAYKAEISDLSAAAFAVTDNLKVPVAQTAKVLDVMAAAGKAGAFEMKDMASYFPALTAGYQGLGQTGVGAAADIAAALQITRKGAGSAEVAATNLQNVIQKMASPDTIKNFAKFGVDLPKALKKAYADGKTPIEAIAELTNKALGGDLGKIGFIFGDAQVQQGLRPLIQNMEEYRRIRAEAGNASGTTDRDFAERMKDSAEQSRQLSVNAQTLGVTLGATLLPAVNAVMVRATAFATRLSAWAQANPQFAKGLMIAAAALAVLFIIFGAGAIAIAGIMGPIALLNAGLIAMGVAGGLASIGLLPIIGTVLAVVAAIAAVGAAVYLIYNNWGAITGFFSGIWASITSFFGAGASAVGGIFQDLWTGVKSVFSMSLMEILGSIAGFVGYALGSLFRFGSSASAWLTGTLPRLLSAGWNAAWSMLTGAISASWAWLTTRLPVVLANGWNVAWATFKAAMTAAFVTLPAMFFNFGAMIVQGLWNGIKSAPGRLWNAGKALAGSVAGGFRKGAEVNSPSRLFARYGGFLTEGLAIGINRGGNAPVNRIRGLIKTMSGLTATTLALPALANAADISVTPTGRPISTASRDASGGAGNSAAGAGSTINYITITAPPGMDEAKLVEMLERKLGELKREGDARARSTFRDRQDEAAYD